MITANTMKTKTRLSLALVFVIPLAACRKPADKGESMPGEAPEVSGVSKQLSDQDSPILALKEGDTWTYRVRVEIPPGITSEGSAAVDLENEMQRVYLGKRRIGEKQPEVDVFEVTKGVEPVERELVEIFDNRILLRGSVVRTPEEDLVQWFETPVVFVFAGMRPGHGIANFSDAESGRERGVEVVARESISVAAGEFDAIRLLMTGSDGDSMLRKTIWFAPKVGIVKEEKSRYLEDRLLFRETTELLKTTVGSE